MVHKAPARSGQDSYFLANRRSELCLGRGDARGFTGGRNERHLGLTVRAPGKVKNESQCRNDDQTRTDDSRKPGKPRPMRSWLSRILRYFGPACDVKRWQLKPWLMPSPTFFK